MRKTLDALDERLRDGLTKPAPAAVCHICGGLTVAAFVLLMMTRTMTQLADAGMAARLASAVMLGLPLAVMVMFAFRLTRESEGGAAEMLLLCAVCAAGMLMRVSFIERSSGDYDIYLANWLDKLAAGSFAEGMSRNIGEYNVLYQYILFIITRLPVPALYAVKAASFIGDALLAGAAAKLAGGKARGAAAFGVVLLLPSIALNGGMFAQCDSLYASCALWGLALALDRKPARSAACFALSLAFKLQAVFLLPIVCVLWADRKLRLSDALVFLGTLVLAALPAMLGGKSPLAIISIYTAQTGLYTGLNYGAAGFYGLMETAGLDVYAYGNFSMALAMGACMLIVCKGMARRGRMDEADYVRLAAVLVLAVVFLLPRMHERYFYMAIPLCAALAARRGGVAVVCAALAELAMLATLWALAIPLHAASLMMLAALVLLLTLPKKA